MNLCVNAVDAMPEGGSLMIRTRNSGTERVELLVADSGCGMPPEVLEKAVDPFFTTKPQGKGTGLGLSIVYATVKAHGGQMEIQSDPGEGTRVLTTLPAHPAKMAELKPHDVPEVAQGCHMRVLVVDDDDLVQAALKDQLEFLGHSVAIASSGEGALQRLEQALEIDVVILDMNMPGLGGAQTLPLLRNLRPHVPVFLTTGRADQHVFDLAKQFSSVSVLPKPFSLRELRTQFNSIDSKGQARKSGT
jgi:CheY-like chemotaxis protein